MSVDPRSIQLLSNHSVDTYQQVVLFLITTPSHQEQKATKKKEKGSGITNLHFSEATPPLLKIPHF
ncbi:hypothetical protein [Pajaroellobacter abortibovis]|uniref:Uncharacterized protein n=1 Tax=Pajaroellobacter abortibovis TaxID=1882918 RepID=A0A1L6MXA7_9BACT|nr:hypothetical protein [Pajaroellobacter abortibovis]APS00157.1 hypothetical protein BCY86_05280 [Pajaroellobacter abortibovis]